ncbi:MAG TPA: outer membrane beta-barrel protein [Terriglobales bacterium]|nr:outer membrane beta-barrel protein [Terriglobales bacterium]
MKFWLRAIVLWGLCLSAVAAQAQKNELSAEGSGLFTSSQYNNDAGVGFQLSYAHRLYHVPLLSLYGEVPFVAGFDNERYSLHNLTRENYKDYYVTPGLRLNFAPGFIVSPWLAGGVGWGHFSSNQGSATDSEFATDWGGGLDIKVFPFVSLRFEARDFYSNVPTLTLPSTGGHQNNVVASGGLVLRF